MTSPEQHEPAVSAAELESREEPPGQEADEKTYCAVHPNIETALRCNRCGRYMCTRCAVPTPVGYRCRECVNQQQDAFYKATQRDYLLGAAVAFGISLLAGLIIPRLFLLGVLLLSLPAGALIGEAVFRVMGRRRGRYMWQITVACIVAGAFLAALPMLLEVVPVLQNLSGVRGGSELTLRLLVDRLLPAVLYVILCSIMAASRVR